MKLQKVFLIVTVALLSSALVHAMTTEQRRAKLARFNEMIQEIAIGKSNDDRLRWLDEFEQVKDALVPFLGVGQKQMAEMKIREFKGEAGTATALYEAVAKEASEAIAESVRLYSDDFAPDKGTWKTFTDNHSNPIDFRTYAGAIGELKLNYNKLDQNEQNTIDLEALETLLSQREFEYATTLMEDVRTTLGDSGNDFVAPITGGKIDALVLAVDKAKILVDRVLQETDLLGKLADLQAADLKNAVQAVLNQLHYLVETKILAETLGQDVYGDVTTAEANELERDLIRNGFLFTDKMDDFQKTFVNYVTDGKDTVDLDTGLLNYQDRLDAFAQIQKNTLKATITNLTMAKFFSTVIDLNNPQATVEGQIQKLYSYVNSAKNKHGEYIGEADHNPHIAKNLKKQINEQIEDYTSLNKDIDNNGWAKAADIAAIP